MNRLRPISTFQPEVPEDEHVDPPDHVDLLEAETPVVKSKKVACPKEQQAKSEISSRTIGSYIETCCYLKAPQRGFNALNFHRTRLRKVAPSIKHKRVYNSLLRGFASKGDFDKAEEVFGLAKVGRSRCDIMHLVKQKTVKPFPSRFLPIIIAFYMLYMKLFK